MCSLLELNKRQPAIIDEIVANHRFGEIDGAISQRLKDLGFLPDTLVHIVAKVLFGKPPYAVQLSTGAQFSLRADELMKIKYRAITSEVIPSRTMLGIFNLQGITLFILYVAGTLSAALVSWLFKRFHSAKSESSAFPLLMELPTYRMPNVKHIAGELWDKMSAFLRKAGTVIFTLSVVLWVLVTFPSAPVNAVGPAIDYSFAGMLGHLIEPIFAPIGFTWQMCISLIPGLAAREIVVAALGTVYAVGGVGDEAINQTLIPIIHAQWGLATAFAFLVFYVCAPMCLATLDI